MIEDLDFGTAESRKHYKTVLEPRGVTTGGMVIATGIKNLIPDLLEALYVAGHLKGKFESSTKADERVINGRGFQELYMNFRNQGKDLAAAEMVYRMMPTLEGHIGSERDIAETVYSEVLRKLGKHGRIVSEVCISGTLSCNAKDIRRALDALPRAMEAAEQIVRDRIDARGTYHDCIVIP